MVCMRALASVRACVRGCVHAYIRVCVRVYADILEVNVRAPHVFT